MRYAGDRDAGDRDDDQGDPKEPVAHRPSASSRSALNDSPSYASGRTTFGGAVPILMKNSTLPRRILPGLILLSVAAATLPVLAKPKPIQSPEVHPDRSVTFRLRAPNAKKVTLDLEGAKGTPMQKDGEGVWSATTGPLEPDFYGYSFSVDGVELHDPSNPAVTPNLLSRRELTCTCPGPASLPWEVNDVPHGALHRHFYKSGVVGDNRDFYVYTPPGYDPDVKRPALYPVLYLLHGFSDDASGWTAVGRTNVILDNLIAQGKAKPMLVVMPLGYGALEMLDRNGPSWDDRSLVERNFSRFRDARNPPKSFRRWRKLIGPRRTATRALSQGCPWGDRSRS